MTSHSVCGHKWACFRSFWDESRQRVTQDTLVLGNRNGEQVANWMLLDKMLEELGLSYSSTSRGLLWL